MSFYVHLFPGFHLLAGLLLFSLGIFSLTRRIISGTGIFAILVFTAGFIAVCNFFEYSLIDLRPKIFFMKLQYFGTVSVSVVWLLLAGHFSGFRNLQKPKFIMLLFIIPCVSLILIWTNMFHHLFWTDIGMTNSGKLLYLTSKKGYWFFVHQFHMFCCFLAGTIFFIRRIIRSPKLYRGQSIAFLVAASIPWIVNTLFNVHVFKSMKINVGTLSLTISGLILWWAIFRYNLLDVIPAAKEKLLENMKAGIVVADMHDRIVELNPFVERLFSVKSEDIVGKNIEKLWPKFAETMPAEWEFENSAGDYFYIEVDRTPIATDKGEVTGYLFLIVNSTEKKKTNMALKKSEDYIYQSQKYEALGRLAGGIAHDFNNILTIIYNFAKPTSQGCEQDINLIEENFKEIQQAVLRGQLLTQQLLAFSKAQIMMEEEVSVGPIINEMRDMLVHFVKPEVRLTFHEEDETGTIRANKHQIEQMVLNLAQNGDEAMPEGGELRIAWGKTFLFEHDLPGVNDVEPGVYAYFSVSDTGTGIKKEYREHIFDPFFTTKGMGKGIGLGLSTVYGIVKQHRGHIETESLKGRGTMVRVYLPAVDT